MRSYCSIYEVGRGDFVVATDGSTHVIDHIEAQQDSPGHYRRWTVVAEGGLRIGMFDARSYYRTTDAPTPPPGMSFRPGMSITRGVPIVEVWFGESFIATICPPPPGSDIAALTIISNHLDAVLRDAKEPPAVLVTFKVKP